MGALAAGSAIVAFLTGGRLVRTTAAILLFVLVLLSL